MKILLLAGGDSSEREISLATSRAVFKSLQRQGHDVLAVDPATGTSLLDHSGRFIETESESSSEPTVSGSATVDPTVVKDLMHSPDTRDIEVVFIGLHGAGGENGSVQNVLDLAGIKYTGSNMTASAVAMNKAIAKRLMTSEGIPTPGWALYHAHGGRVDDSITEAVSREFHFPVIVKPNDSGSTVGLTRVDKVVDLPEALRRAADESPDILIENYIPGRELTVAVLDGESLPVVEIKPKNGLYDYEAKYTTGKTKYIAPAEVDANLAAALQAAAAKLFGIIGASGLARVDFLLDSRGDYYCLELNTLPGMTDLSLAPMAAKCVGIDFDQLVDRVIKSALTG
jgi:D-alanine-D-alanine ligase